MSDLRAIVAEVRRAASGISASDAEVAREVGDVCEEMLAERGGAQTQNWRDEIVARTATRLRASTQ